VKITNEIIEKIHELGVTLTMISVIIASDKVKIAPHHK